MPETKLLTVAEVAQILGISRPQVYKLLEHGLPSLRLHDRGDRRFDPADVAKWVETRKAVDAR